MNASGAVDGSDAWHWFVYDPQWRIVATYRIPTSWGGSADSSPKERFIYHNAGVAGSGSSSYIDEVILRDRDNTSGWDAASDGTLEERAYYLHNWRHDVVALVGELGYVLERTKYSAYGVSFRVLPADVNADGYDGHIATTQTSHGVVAATTAVPRSTVALASRNMFADCATLGQSRSYHETPFGGRHPRTF